MLYTACAELGYIIWRWKWPVLPARFMPKEAARLWFKVRSIGLERVQDISAEDCVAEGLSLGALRAKVPLLVTIIVKHEFQREWDKINGKREGCSWAENPWEWRYELERLEGKPVER